MPFAAWCESAPLSAARRALRFTLTSKLRIPGGNATPPPVNCGARIVPWRARPVPFWRHGFARPPATSPRLFAPRVPRRAAFSSERTVSWRRCGLTSTSKTVASSATSFAVPPSTVALTAISARLLPDLDEPALRARHGAADEQQVPLGVHLVDDEPGLRDAVRAHVAGHLLALEHARRRRRRADRARLADVVRAVADRAAVEVVPLDRALEALPDRDARHLDPVAGLEGLDGDGLAGLELARAAELDEVPVPADARLAEVAELALRQLPVGDRVERELDGLVAVGRLGSAR